MKAKTIQRILYASDLGAQMRPVLIQTVDIAKQYDAQVIMMNVVEPMGETASAMLDTYLSRKDREKVKDEGLKKVISVMKQRLARFCEEEEDLCKDGKSIISEVVVVAGNAADEIVNQAIKKSVDLIVIGSCGHTSNGDLIGSVTRKVTQKSPIPVLIVPNNSKKISKKAA